MLPQLLLATLLTLSTTALPLHNNNNQPTQPPHPRSVLSINAPRLPVAGTLVTDVMQTIPLDISVKSPILRRSASENAMNAVVKKIPVAGQTVQGLIEGLPVDAVVKEVPGVLEGALKERDVEGTLLDVDVDLERILGERDVGSLLDVDVDLKRLLGEREEDVVLDLGDVGIIV